MGLLINDAPTENTCRQLIAMNNSIIEDVNSTCMVYVCLLFCMVAVCYYCSTCAV